MAFDGVAIGGAAGLPTNVAPLTGPLPINDDVPLPALRIAWQAWGQPVAVLDGAPTVAAALRIATREFLPDRLPKVTSLTFAAAHNNAAAGAV